MLYPYKKGNNEWTNTVPYAPEATPYTPLWSSGDGYLTNNLLIYRVSDSVVTTTGAYSSQRVIYNIPVEDSTNWYDTTTGLWTPTVAGWWQITIGALNNGGAIENLINLSGAVYANDDTIGLNTGTCTAFGYFNGTTSNASVTLATGNASTVTHQQTPQTTYFQAIYLRP